MRKVEIIYIHTPKIIQKKRKKKEGVTVMVFNTTFNNISAILSQAVILLEETRVPGENHRPVASH